MNIIARGLIFYCPKDNIHLFGIKCRLLQSYSFGSNVHIAVHVYKCTGDQGFLVSPESDRVDCLDAWNFPRLRVTSKLPS